MLYLGAILDAFANYEDLEDRRTEARQRARSRNPEGVGKA